MNRILLAFLFSALGCTASAGSPRALDDSQVNCPKPAGRSIGGAVVPVASATNPTVNTPTASAPAVGQPALVKPAAAAHSDSVASVHGSPVNHGHGGAAAAPRIISPRWHSFLPGMFR